MLSNLYQSIFNRSQIIAKQNDEYDVQAARLKNLLQVADWFVKAHARYDERDPFSTLVAKSVTDPAWEEAKGKRIPAIPMERQSLARAVGSIEGGIELLFAVINGRKAEVRWGTDVAELTRCLKMTCDLLDGTCSFEQYKKFPDELEGAPWKKTAMVLAAIAAGLLITGAILLAAFVYTANPALSIASFGFMMTALVSGYASSYFDSRTGLSRFADMVCDDFRKAQSSYSDLADKSLRKEVEFQNSMEQNINQLFKYQIN